MIGFIIGCCVIILFIFCAGFSMANECTLKQKLLIIFLTIITYAGIISLIMFLVTLVVVKSR